MVTYFCSVYIHKIEKKIANLINHFGQLSTDVRIEFQIVEQTAGRLEISE